MKPPKCKSCGKEEWSHICAGEVERMRPANVPDGVISLEPRTVPGLPPPSAKITRKEYLKFKARERRARERAAGVVKS